MSFLRTFISLLFDALTLAIFLRAILSWVAPGQTNILTNIVYQVTEPLLAPLRRVVPRVGMLDLTPLVAIVLLQLIGSLLIRFLLP